MPYRKRPLRKRFTRELRNFVTVFALPAALAGIVVLGQVIRSGWVGVAYAAAIWLALGGLYVGFGRPWWRRRAGRRQPGSWREYFWPGVRYAMCWPHYAARNLLGVERSPF